MMILPMPNGNGGMNMMIIPTVNKSSPSEYFSYFKTPSGVDVTVTYHTADKAAADMLADSIHNTTGELGWEKRDPNTDEPLGLVGELVMAWILMALVALCLAILAFLGIAATDMAGWLEGDAFGYMKRIMPYLLWLIPVGATMLNGLSIVDHYRKD